jgi:hypothetical protein
MGLKTEYGQGRRVTAMSSTVAAIETPGGGILKYRKIPASRGMAKQAIYRPRAKRQFRPRAIITKWHC